MFKMRSDLAMIRCIVTSSDHINGDMPGLHVVAGGKDSHLLVQVNRKRHDFKCPDEPSRRACEYLDNLKYVKEFIDGYPIKQPVFFYGGECDIESIFVLHDQNTDISPVIKFDGGLVSMSSLDDWMKTRGELYLPLLVKLLTGFTEITPDRLTRNIDAGRWIECKRCFPRTLTKLDWPFGKMPLRS